jgi:hypothetical protein
MDDDFVYIFYMSRELGIFKIIIIYIFFPRIYR